MSNQTVICRHCGTGINKYSIKQHEKQCVDKTEEERKHYREHRIWRQRTTGRESVPRT